MIDPTCDGLIECGQTYLLPGSMEEGWLYVLPLARDVRRGGWLSLLLDSGELMTVESFFFTPDRKVVR